MRLTHAQAEDAEGKDDLVFYQKTAELLQRQMRAQEQTTAELNTKHADLQSEVRSRAATGMCDSLSAHRDTIRAGRCAEAAGRGASGAQRTSPSQPLRCMM